MANTFYGPWHKAFLLLPRWTSNYGWIVGPIWRCRHTFVSNTMIGGGRRRWLYRKGEPDDKSPRAAQLCYDRGRYFERDIETGEETDVVKAPALR